MDPLMIFASNVPSLRPDQGWFHEKDFTLRQVESSTCFFGYQAWQTKRQLARLNSASKENCM